MTSLDRRGFLMAAATAAALPPAIARARAIDADVRTGTIKDVEHVVIFMQENRSFDHYFGSMAGVRGFGDRFPIPVPDTDGLKNATVWTQLNKPPGLPLIAPFHLNTVQTFAHMRVEGTPHLWPDAQGAWNEGRMNHWPVTKTEHSMGYYKAADAPFQFALAEAFTLCDAYHCSILSGTNPNRLFLWTGTNDPTGRDGGPGMANSHDRFVSAGGHARSYSWTSYVERLDKAGVSWRLYQDMADNFTDNPLAGFKAFRESYDKVPGSDPRLAERALTTRMLDGLREDVVTGKLPQVSYIIARAADSEHPGPSSPAQGADFTAQVLDALTADPKVWAKTALFVMFDENDGFFDHAPPPAPPSRDASGGLLGASTTDTAGEYHLVASTADPQAERPELMGRPYGLGPRVPMYVISPWSRGGWVDSEVFDHTSVIRFLETRFGVLEPNITPWRRTVCGDLTSAFDFKTPNDAPFFESLPKTAETAARARALPGRTAPPTPALPEAPIQAAGARPSRALPYRLDAGAQVTGETVTLTFANTGKAGAVFHVYDRLALDLPPRRYTVGAGKRLQGVWAARAGAYDLWVLGPAGFHRHMTGQATQPLEALLAPQRSTDSLTLVLRNTGKSAIEAKVSPQAYADAHTPWTATLAPGDTATHTWPLKATGGWYDLAVTSPTAPGFLRRLAGRIETGRDSVSDPAMGGAARMTRA
ncbi:phosphocholine-specific phospholipase C [Phenylobacterium aquaticum]|uniref:phosphocholine-specific phospholipase C n=1 Tax=Phenylobacterium aquaticum TaxID=1763816 RepID=UPI001F5C25AD|nr:phospholipase C, phosphocholine-specific [Phenylobacterium aquaticum]MCI3131779.1 phospholipase C, phosphocholine-specific [Phenylobacterium aquaticum]